MFPYEMIYIKCQNIYSGKIKKKTFQIIIGWIFYPAYRELTKVVILQAAD